MRIIVEFTYHLHDEADAFDRRDEIAASAGVEIDDALMDRIGRPFYEVCLHCTLDTESGAVVIRSAERV